MTTNTNNNLPVTSMPPAPDTSKQEWEERLRTLLFSGVNISIEEIKSFIQQEIDKAAEEATRKCFEKIQELRDSGFSEGDTKRGLVAKYEQALEWAKQKPLTESNRYDFYRGIEYACDEIKDKIEKGNHE